MRARWRVGALSFAAAALLALSSSAWADNDKHHKQHHDSGTDATAFTTVLLGENETPANNSAGEGLASFLVSHDGTTLYYTLMATNTTSSVTAAHIHLGEEDVSGPVIVNLCGAGSTPACGTESVIASGAVHASDFVGPMTGKSMADLLNAMADGQTYANIHTTQFPAGELRGQIDASEDTLSTNSFDDQADN